MIVESDTAEIYRPRTAHWVFWGIVLLLVPGFIVGLSYLLLETDPFARTVFYGALFVWLVCFVVVLDKVIIPMRKSFMIVDRRGIRGRDNRFEYDVFWIEIVMANLFEGYSLLIATRKDAFQITLRCFDAKRIWQRICDHLNPEQVGQVAYENWLSEKGFYEKVSETNADIVRNTPVPIRTRRKTGWMILGWIGLLVFGGIALCSFGVGQSHTIWYVMVLAIGPGLLLGTLIFPRIVEMDSEGVYNCYPIIGRRGIRWDEIVRIEHTPGLDRVVFYGDDKSLSILGPSQWERRQGPKMWAFLLAQIEQRSIETYRI